jgi:hypothetical protein
MSNIKVNAAEWNHLSDENKAQITSIMKENGFLKGAAEIVGEEGAPKAADAVKASAAHLKASATSHRSAPSGTMTAEAFKIKIPSFACDIAEAAAVAACALVPVPGNMVCVAVAHAGGEYCRKQSNK